MKADVFSSSPDKVASETFMEDMSVEFASLESGHNTVLQSTASSYPGRKPMSGLGRPKASNVRQGA